MKYSFFILIIIFFFGANYWIFQRIYTLFNPSIVLKIVFIVLAIFLSTSFLISNFFEEYLPFPMTSLLAKIGSSWFFIVLYFAIIFGIQELCILIGKIGVFPDVIVRFVSRSNKFLTVIELIFVFAIFSYGYYNYMHKKRTHITYKVKKDIPDFEPFRIVLLSDMHLGYTIGETELRKWLNQINDEKPDLILIAGDLLDSSVKAVDRPEITNLLSQLQSKYGTYACLGNHEYLSTGAHIDQTNDFYKKSNIHLLRDDDTLINDVYVIGRDDRMNSDRKTIKQLTDSLDRNKLWIVLDHQPYNLELAQEAGVDLQFSGHTHQGQVWPISIITNAIYEKDYGLLEKGLSTFYVSSGMGIWGGKFRIGTNSEYVVVDVVKD